MPVRATKRGAERTSIDRDCDVLVCGASFAGLAVARELSGCGAKVLLVDRYQIGERQTSACGIPTEWLTRLSLQGSLRQTFSSLLVHTPSASVRWQLPWSFSTFDYRELCALLWQQAGLRDDQFETATVNGISRAAGAHQSLSTGAAKRLTAGCGLHTVHTDRGEIRAPLVVDALGWRRVLSQSPQVQPPNARLSRGLEVHPNGSREEMELWIDPRHVRAGYAWSFPAHDELRVGVGSFWPTHHVKEPTVRLAAELQLPAVRYQGNWIPHQLRPATEAGVFFVGDSAGHCLPLTAEGIRTALYFGLACGRELHEVLAGRASPQQALRRYAAFSQSHEWKFRWLLRTQHAIGALNTTPLVGLLTQTMRSRSFTKWAFDHYLAIAPPSFVQAPPGQAPGPPRARRALATA
jgi:menaquinone-9 beta-reductase